MYYILYSYNKVRWGKENVVKKIIRKRKYIYSAYQYCTFMSSLYKMHPLSVPTSLLSCTIQNTVEVISMINTRPKVKR